MMRCLAPLLAVLLLLVPAAARAAPTETLSISLYGVKGRTVNELIRSLDRHSPGGSWAYTSWRITRPACRTTLAIRQTLPRWRDRSTASVAVRKTWDRFYAALLAHEARHVQIARSAAAAVDDLTCTADYTATVGKWIADERAFDRRTRHGIATGATLRYE